MTIHFKNFWISRQIWILKISFNIGHNCADTEEMDCITVDRKSEDRIFKRQKKILADFSHKAEKGHRWAEWPYELFSHSFLAIFFFSAIKSKPEEMPERLSKVPRNYWIGPIYNDTLRQSTVHYRGYHNPCEFFTSFYIYVALFFSLPFAYSANHFLGLVPKIKILLGAFLVCNFAP